MVVMQVCVDKPYDNSVTIPVKHLISFVSPAESGVVRYD